MNLWDVAAGIILVKEAGGIVDNFELNKFDKISLKHQMRELMGFEQKISIF